MAWIVSALVIALILIRPWRIPEALWACSGAIVLLVSRELSLPEALAAIGRGSDVYLFLVGMMLLAELARREGLFDWIAGLAVRKAKGSRARLFAIVYSVGVVVTIFLSNDATAVVLTPAVLAVVRKARATPLPYLLACAFIANAASFVLPISNPANLVIYGPDMPPLLSWLRTFALPSVVSIITTYIVLWFLSRKDLAGKITAEIAAVALTNESRTIATGIAATAVVLSAASFFRLDLGLPTLLSALGVVGLIAIQKPETPFAVLKKVSWSVIPLVAALFIIVCALDHAGALAITRSALGWCGSLPRSLDMLAAAFGVAALSNIMNNLPVALIAGHAIHGGVATAIRDSLVIGVDLGPNLSVTGSLATILWLLALRSEGEDITAWRFLKFGVVLMPIALAAAILSLWQY